MTVAAVIQARAGSTRFPGKVLAPLCGRPMLQHCVERLLLSPAIDVVVVATTDQELDNPVAALAERLGARCVRGSEDDVLARYVMARDAVDADIVVRITADCPLVDAELVGQVVELLLGEGAEYASNVMPACYPDGYDVEVMTAACLLRLHGEANLPYEREHVTARVRESPGAFRIASLSSGEDLSTVRLTVDVPADLARLELILSALPQVPPPGLRDVLQVMKRLGMTPTRNDLPGRDERYHEQRRAARGSGA